MTKKNLRKIPAGITAQINAKPDQTWVAGCAKTISRQDIQQGVLSHLGIVYTESGIQIPASVVPLPSQGKYSRRNVEGYEIVRRDLPKDPNYKPHDVPNWGSLTSTHTVYLPHPRFPRDLVAPTLTEISMQCSNLGTHTDQLVLTLRVDLVLSPRDPNFENTLLSNLNILQENIGACGVHPADRSITDLAHSLHVDWEILPPGTAEETISRIFRGNSGTAEERETAADRFAFFESLSAVNHVYGLSGNLRYFGAILPNGMAIFENLRYGNAVYIFFSNWERHSQLSRIELLSGRQGKDICRVQHISGWQSKVREIINQGPKIAA